MASTGRARDLNGRGADLKLFVRDVRDRQGRKRPITLKSWSTIQDIKNLLQQSLHVPSSAQLLYFGPLMTSGVELPNHWTLQDAGIHRSGETILLDIKGAGDRSASITSLQSSAVSDVCVSSSMIDSTEKSLRHIVQQARRGFNLGLKPELVMDGSGGTYFLHDARKVKVAVFKPADEEPYAENNPRGYVKQGGNIGSLREGIDPGEACLREVAAYMLDHKSFAGVPMTTLAEARHPAFNTNGARLKLSEGGASVGAHSLMAEHTSPTKPKQKKVGSFQEFVKVECTMDDMSPSKISVDEVQKIAILDIRIMNADRNSANLLCRRRPDDSIELVPIDHGYSLRTVCDVSWMDWCWLDWPQLKQPLSEESRKYVLDLDIEAEARLLKEQLNIPAKAIDYFRASSKLLQAGVRAGLSLYDIAVMCCRNDNAGEIPSKLEVLTGMAYELANATQNARYHHSAASNALAEQLSPGGGSLLIKPHSRDVSSNRILKSQSSVQLSSFCELDVNQGEAPTMTQSSASDSSSDVGDALSQKEECEEWAAGIIADVSMTASLEKTPQRLSVGELIEESSQVSDGDSEDSSEVGFWYIRPGSEEDDEEDFSWSPHISPRASFHSTSTTKYKNLESMAPSATMETSTKSTMLSFVDGSFLLPPSSVSIFKRESSDSSEEKVVSFPSLRKTGSLIRSASYSAFSEHSGPMTENLQSQASFAENTDQFREYFAKFVDLVIVRETSAASLAVAEV
mmetsp:Transcript_7946/g.10384  ORF Transcript_7946/g.10384 Transcript_7946/m.10384 type:complete len:741 (+) Transcript_7946:89-2311(+)